MANGNSTTYEWDIETVNIETGDIYDHTHNDNLPDALASLKNWPADDGFELRLVLVRDVHRDYDLASRSWAYIENGKLPDHFSDGLGGWEADMPKRFKDLWVKYGEAA